MFMGNLQGPYLDRMVGRTTSGFSDLVLANERIKNMIKMSKIRKDNDTKLPTEGRNHNKALHISIECVDIFLSRVLVDTGSSLNVMPKGSLAKLVIEGIVMKPSELVVRVFDGSKRAMIGEIDLPTKICPIPSSSSSL